ncbi:MULTISPECIES: phenylacetate--CoA ligase family protein [Polaromonas]|uniref:Phenylacetate--CoA ligase family protein n=1 Tax=Polaromonas aquatica TaxID=332657 RepID=A0ABW1U560_9BURK
MRSSRQSPSFTQASPLLARLAAASRPELEALQLAKVQRLVERLWNTNAFYRRKWEAHGVSPAQIRTLDDFRQRIPMCTKQEFIEDQGRTPPFGTRLGLPEESAALVNLTGGTSGQGQEFYGRSQKDVVTQGYMHYLPWFMAGMRRGHNVLNCVPAGGMSTGGWGPAEGIRLAGATGFHVGGTLSTDAKIGLMLRLGDVHFIYASTNYMHTLTQGLLARGIPPSERFPMMQAVFIAAEGYPVEWAAELQVQWGCPVHEGYGSTQGAGFIASTCEHGVVRSDRDRGLMHLFEWAHLVEVIDPDTGKPAMPGEEGEIVLTNLDIEASPVVRFSTRDRVRWFPAAACGCGRPWDVIEAGSIGRYDDMLKVRGNNIWPVTMDQVVFAHVEVADYKGRVFVDDQGRTEVEICMAFKPGVSEGAARAALVARLREKLKERTNLWIQIREIPAAELPEFSYKARRWTDERRSGYGKQAAPSAAPTTGGAVP